MRLAHRRAACRRALAAIATVVLCIGTMLPAARAQDAAIASAGETVLLRESPGYDASVLAPLADGSALQIAGEPLPAADGSSWLPIVAGGQSGYVPAGFVADALAPEPASTTTEPEAVPDPAAPEPAEAAPAASAAMTTTDANLRAEPNQSSEILQVLPPNTPVMVDGAAVDGFVPVSGNGVSGWIAVELLGEASSPAASNAPPPLVAPESDAPASAEPPEQAPEAASRESTGIGWPFSGGEWEVVQGYNNGTHTNRGGGAQYKYSLDWARSDGDTAGQPVYAPVSGTIEWVDRGSGGILIDAGNGYGVALFHVTYDGGLDRGGQIERGQPIGTVSGPGGDGYESMAHVDMTCWRLAGRGRESVPFDGPNAIAGQAFPDVGGGNQYMGTTVNP